MHSLLAINLSLYPLDTCRQFVRVFRVRWRRPDLAATVALWVRQPCYGATHLPYACQISSRYSRIVRSEENQPDMAVLWSARRFQSCVSGYVAVSFSQAST